MSRSRTQSPMPSSLTATSSPNPNPDLQPSTSLRKSLRKWMDRLKRDPSSHRPSNLSSSRPATPSDHGTPIPVPAILFVPTTQTIISSPKDPRNTQPNTIKKLRASRRNTAPANYFSTSSANGATKRDRSVSRNRNTSTSRDTSATRIPSASRDTSARRPRNEAVNGPTIANERTRPEPVYQVTTTITATNPPLRSRRSRIRLSFSRSASPVTTQRSRAPSTNSMSSSNHTRNASVANSVSSSAATSYLTSSTRHSPNVRDVRAPSQIFEEGSLSKPSLESAGSNKENKGKEAAETVVEVRQNESEEGRQEIDQEVTKGRKQRDDEVLLRAADIRLGMMV